MLPKILFILLFAIPSSFSNVGSAATPEKETRRGFAGEGPFTARAALIRYWRKHVSGDNIPNSFFLSKASPLTAVELAKYSKLAGKRSLSTHLSAFCKAAGLLCFPEVGPSLASHQKDVNFAVYRFDNFTNYGTARRGGADSFRAYSNNETSTPSQPIAIDTFRRYSRGSVDHVDKFTTYANGTTVPHQTFNSYGTKAITGAGDFGNYFNNTVIVNDAVFASYSDNAKGRKQDFKEYANNGILGDQNFTSYGKNAEKATNKFTTYGENSSGIDNNFNNYAENGAAATDNFTSYAANERITENHFNNYAAGANAATQTFTTYTPGGAIPISEFKSYGSGGNGVHQEFINYSENSISPHHKFTSYGAGSKSEILGFVNYAASSDEDNFVGYDKNTTGQKISFKTYKPGNRFKDYAKTGATFSTYLNQTAAAVAVSKVRVEPGKFFREKMLKTGTVMPMPDIRDKMPKRSFLPRVINSKLPFSSGKLDELKEIFHAGDDSGLVGILTNALTECERAPSVGETKKCAGSGEDMIDFATSALGKNVAVRTTENTRGSGGNIMIGAVTGINGGKVTKSISCHQSLYPSLLYYCHSVPKVRVYEADILDPISKEKINHGVAICHIDTSMWSSGHGAFIALGSGPGNIEVCHWIFENDMTWTISD